MKRIILILGLLLPIAVLAQVIIGDATGTAPASKKGSVLLEFANTNNKGILVPAVRTLPSTPAEGTIVLDATSPDNARIKFYNNNGTTADKWTDLSGQGADVSTYLSAQPTASQAAEGAAAKVIIGSATSPADGALVLESNTKALVLPIVDDVNSIPSPSAGMVVYIKGTAVNPNKRLAVYNGSKWSFWKKS